MKKILFAMTAMLVMLAGCKKAEISTDGVGSVNFNIQKDSTFRTVDTRALPSVDVNTFNVTIQSQDGSFSQNWNSYSEFPSVLELVLGNYTVTASSPAQEKVAWEQPTYSVTQDFAIFVGKVSNVDLVCPITNMMVTINPSEAFLKEISEFEITVKSQDGQLVWTKEEVTAGKQGFFAVSPLEIWVKGTRYNGGVAPQQYHKITSVAAKDHHIINLDARVTGELGGIDITIDNTVNDKNENIQVPGFEEIPVPGNPDHGQDGGQEPDPEPQPSTAPTLEWAANPNFDVVPLSFNDVNVNINAQETIKSVKVKVESATEEFISTVALMVSPENAHTAEGYVILDLTDDPVAVEQLATMLPVGDALKGQTSVALSLSELIPLINGFKPEPGSITTFTLNVTDALGQTLEQPLKFKAEAAPAKQVA